MDENGTARDELGSTAVTLRRLIESVEGIRQAVPRGLRVCAALSWRLLLVAGTLYVLGIVVSYLATLIVPVAVALLFAALLGPGVGYLVRHRVPRGVATAVVLIGGLALIGGVLTFVVITFVQGLPELRVQLSNSINAITDWLTAGPLHLSEQQFRVAQQKILEALSASQADITAGALTTATTVGELLAESLLMLFTLIFFLYDGARIWRFVIRAVPAGVRDRVDIAGQRSQSALVSYVRATAGVAVVDAAGIGVGLAILGVPLALSLAMLVFLGAFIPVLGAVLAGGVAVLVALVTKGFLHALLVLGLVIAVMQLEGHVLQPLLLGRAVNLHPLAVVLSISAGLLAAGIVGALLAVPLLAVLNAGIRSLRSGEQGPPDEPGLPSPEPQPPPEPPVDPLIGDVGSG